MAPIKAVSPTVSGTYSGRALRGHILYEIIVMILQLNYLPATSIIMIEILLDQRGEIR